MDSRKVIVSFCACTIALLYCYLVFCVQKNTDILRKIIRFGYSKTLIMDFLDFYRGMLAVFKCTHFRG